MNDAALSCYKLITTNFNAVRRMSPLEGRLFKVVAAIAGNDTLPLLQEAKKLDGKCLDQILPQADNIAIAKHFIRQSPCIHTVVAESSDGTGVLLDHEGNASQIVTIRLEAAHYLPKVPAAHRCRQLHGHSYVLQCLLPISSVAEIVSRLHKLQGQLDRCCLNEVEGLDNPTCELFAAWIWLQIPGMHGVSVRETPTSGCFYNGSDFFIWRDMRTESAVKTVAGQCFGHSYRARFYLRLPLDQDMGWCMDFGKIKQLLAPVHQQLDHKLLTDIPGLQNYTDNALTAWMYDRIKAIFPSMVRLELEAAPDSAILLSELKAGTMPPATNATR